MALPLRSSHPAAQQLSDFSLGKLDVADVEAIADHLSSCPDCLATVQNVPADTFVSQLIAAHGPLASDSPAQVGQVQDPVGLEVAGNPPESTPHGTGPGSDDQSARVVPAELAGHPKFRIVRRLGKDGMGAVYLAEHLLMGRQVAVKVVSKASRE